MNKNVVFENVYRILMQAKYLISLKLCLVPIKLEKNVKERK